MYLGRDEPRTTTLSGDEDVLDKLCLVLLRYGHICTSRLQLDCHEFSKALFLNAKRLFNDVCNVIFPVVFALAPDFLSCANLPTKSTTYYDAVQHLHSPSRTR